MRELSYANAIKEATDFCLEVDQSVLVIGLGVPDPKGIFGTTKGINKKHSTFQQTIISQFSKLQHFKNQQQ